MRVPAAPATITVTPNNALAGTAVTVNGANFAPNEPVNIGIGLTTLVTVTANAQGVLPTTQLTIPAGPFAGAYTVFALGRVSLRLATAPLVVRAPHLHVQPATAPPGAAVTVSGDSFGPNEEVTVGFDLTPTVNVAATSDGILPTTSITVPLTAPPGRHIVYAYGMSSARLITATLTVLKPQPEIALNATAYDVGRQACVRGIGYGANESVLITLNGETVTTGQADASGGVALCFAMPGTIVAGANVLAARGLQTGATATTSFTGIPSISTTYYFAGGSTANGDATDLPLLNAGTARTRVTLTFYTRHDISAKKTVTLPAHSHLTLHLASYVKAGNAIGVRVQADHAIVAQMVVHRKNGAPYTTAGVPALSNTWYLADGYTAATFHELLYVLNPQAHSVTILIQALSTGQERPRWLSYTVPAGRIATLDVNRLYPRHTIGAVVYSSHQVLVTRVMTFGPHAYGATADNGTATLQSTWLYANGSIAGGVQTYLAVLNPTAFRARVSVSLYGATGQSIALHTEPVPPHRRASILLNNLLPGAGDDDFSIAVRSTIPLAVERTMYTGDPNRQRVASSTVVGPPTAATTWLFAAGDTTGGQHEYLTAYNPGLMPLTVYATFYLESGGTTTAAIPLPARGRVSVDATAVAKDLPASLHGVQLTSSNPFAPFVAEQNIDTPDGTLGYSSVGVGQ